MNVNDLDAKIDKYLLGKMSPEEKTEFENLLEKDHKLLEEVLLRKDVIVAVHIAVKEKLNELAKKTPVKEEEQVKKIPGKYIVLAILIFGILSLLLVLLFKIFSEK